MHGHEVTDPDRGCVVNSVRGNARGHRGQRDDDDGACRRRRPVGDGVGERGLRLEAAGRGDPQLLPVDDLDGQAGVGPHREGLDNQDPARRVEVVVEDRNRRTPPGRQQGDVVLGARLAVGVDIDDVDPDHPGRGRGTVGNDVVEVDRPGDRGSEPEGPRRRVHGHPGPGGGRTHLGQPQFAAIGISVVLERSDDDLAVLDHPDVVGVGHRRDVRVVAQVDVEDALGLVPFVAHDDLDLVTAGLELAEVLDGHHAVLAELGFEPLRRDDLGDEEGVTVGIPPVGSHVVLGPAGRGDRDARLRPPLLGWRVRRPRAHGDAHRRVVGLAPAVGRRVGEGPRPGGLGRHVDDQGATTASRTQRGRPRRCLAGNRGEHVTIGVRVVLQHGQHRSPPRTHPKRVVDRVWLAVLVVSLG